jgi:hypothetical protein
MANPIIFCGESITFGHNRAKVALAVVTLLAGLVLIPGNARAEDDAARARIQSSGLPNVETLTYESDYTVFLRPNVPLELHRAALRKLWSFPAFNQTDGLTSYAEDYSTERDDLMMQRLVQSEKR